MRARAKAVGLLAGDHVIAGWLVSKALPSSEDGRIVLLLFRREGKRFLVNATPDFRHVLIDQIPEPTDEAALLAVDEVADRVLASTDGPKGLVASGDGSKILTRVDSSDLAHAAARLWPTVGFGVVLLTRKTA